MHNSDLCSILLPADSNQLLAQLYFLATRINEGSYRRCFCRYPTSNGTNTAAGSYTDSTGSDGNSKENANQPTTIVVSHFLES